ncbi:MAG: cation:proton antiporter [Myxococcales bacterium]|nr:cation:proton antiporter [Myxococcales bacterium]
MSDPVTVFMLVVSGLLVVGTVGEQIFARTGVPAVIWLILLGVLTRVAGIVPTTVITGLAPFFMALALVIILFDAGRHLTFWSDNEAVPERDRKRALLLAVLGFFGTMVPVALLSMGLYALKILPAWSWTHAFMLGSLMGAGAGEVFLPSLGQRTDAGAVALLRREASITKAMAVIGTVLFLDLMSPRVAEGRLWLALVAAFGFALLFGLVVGAAWILLLQRLVGNPRIYLYTLAAMIAVYVLSETAGGSGPLSVLLFGVALGNAETVIGLRRGAAAVAGETGTVHAALADHDGTIQFVRTLTFALVGLMLAPPWGPLVMGVALGFLPLIVRLLVARFVLSASDHAERATLGGVAPRGLATVALATLALQHGLRGSGEMMTLVFSAVTTSVVLFTVGLQHDRAKAGEKPAAERPVEARPPARLQAPPAGVDARAPTMREPTLRADEEADGGRVVAASEAVGFTRVDVPAAPLPDEPLPPVLASPLATRPVAIESFADPMKQSGRTVVSEPTQQGGRGAVAEQTGRTVVSEPGRTVSEPTQQTGRTVMSEPMQQAGRGAVAEQTGRTVVSEPAQTGRTVVAGTRAPLVGMQEAPSGVSAAIDRELAVPRPGGRAPEVYMPTLPTIDAARAHGENPLDSAMARALAKRPEAVPPGRARGAGEFDAPPPSFIKFEGATEADTSRVLDDLEAPEKK